ncbi:metallophosphoesterase [Paenibacillus sp. R14(2021)]|uniref:metallophosphoesterase n=1 Tax=Paenibacillus sp. R14(2021) TaxID=2859228 RepID=UPI001C6132F7|nr:metallophosphoesterase [Paenibacillus sp. R14(2021)]
MRKLPAPLRVLLILLLFTFLQAYVGWHLQFYLEEATGTGILGAVFWPLYVLIAFGYLFARLLRRVLPGFLVTGLKKAGALWIAVFEYSVLMLPPADLLVWLLRAASVPKDTAIMCVGSAVILLLAAIMLRGSWNAWSPVIRNYEITIDKAAGELQQLHIVVASDLHLGTTVGRKHLNRLVERVNGLQADIMLLPGDVLDDDVEPFIRHDFGSQLAQIQTRFGTYAILGNHEYYGGGIETYVKRMRELGLPVLLDETLLIDGSFYLIGRKDKTDRNRASAAELSAGLDGAKPMIMLDHQPGALREIAEAGIDLSLHGHTHRGQMAPNHLVTKRIFELDWGYLRKGSLHAIVSSGYGTWGPPIRIGSRSEILSIIVRFNCQ